MSHHHEHPAAGGQAQPEHHHASHGRKLHKDWRLWLMVGLMLVGMAIYLLTLDLR